MSLHTIKYLDSLRLLRNYFWFDIGYSFSLVVPFYPEDFTKNIFRKIEYPFPS